jgi:hypothetical protein
MTGREIDEMLHKIREEHAKEIEGLSIAERVQRANEIAERYTKEHGLRIYKPKEKSRV